MNVPLHNRRYGGRSKRRTCFIDFFNKIL